MSSREDLAAAVARVSAEITALGREADELTAAHDERPSSTDLVVSGDAAAEQVSRQLQRLHDQVAAKHAEIEAKASEMKALMEAQMQSARDLMAPLKGMLKDLAFAVETIELYLGVREQVTVLADGEPAAADEPICVRQMVLAMDEECMVAAEKGGLTGQDVGKFDRWLLEDPAHLQQVAPDPRCIVAFVPRRKERDDNPLGRSDEDRQPYLLLRNGDRLLRLCPRDWEAGWRLFPTANEFRALFTTTRDGEEVPLRPGSLDWDRANDRATALERHYLKAAMLMEGLLARTTAFHPLPAGKPVSLLDPAAERAGTVRLVRDAEGLTDGRVSFREWQRRLNAQLRPGQRIVGAFGYDFVGQFESREQWNRGCNERLHPPRAETPPTGEPLMIEERAPDGALIVRYERGKIYDPNLWREDPNEPGWGWRGGERAPKQRASCRLYPGDDFILPFDLASREELVGFLHARSERRHYLDLAPIIRGAIATKDRETAEEQPFRLMLAGVLARENHVSVEDAAADVDELVDWYRTANRHYRPLLEDDAKATAGIVTEHARRQAVAARPVNAKLVDRLTAEHPDALLIARRRSDGRYLVLTPQEPGETLFCAQLEYGARGKLKDRRDWILVGGAAARWQLIYESEAWTLWPRHRSAHDRITGPERDAIAAQIKERAPGRLVRISEDVRYKALVAYFVAGSSEARAGGLRLRSERFRWRRHGKSDVVCRVDFDNRAEPVNRPFPFDSRPNPWEPPRGERVLWEDLEAVAHAEAVERAHDARAAKREARRLRIDRATRTIAKRAAELIEHDSLQLFLRDHDEHLWTWHRKAHSLPEWDAEQRDHAERLITAAVDARLELEELTVTAIAAATRLPVEPLDARLSPVVPVPAVPEPKEEPRPAPDACGEMQDTVEILDGEIEST